MNRQGFAGMCLQLGGRINQTWGELTGDPLRTMAGRRDQIAGRTQQTGGTEQQEAARQLKDFQHRNRDWQF